MQEKKSDKTGKNDKFLTVEDQLKAFAHIIAERILKDQQQGKFVKD